MVLLFSRYSDAYLKWLDFYRKDNSLYLEITDMGIIDEALDGEPEEFEKQTNSRIDQMFNKK